MAVIKADADVSLEWRGWCIATSLTLFFWKQTGQSALSFKWALLVKRIVADALHWFSEGNLFV